MPKNPLAEVFGFPPDNMSADAVRHRQYRLCPFHNSSGMNCTKDKATDPLGVCTIHSGTTLAVTCPVRLRQGRLILSDATEFFFGPGTQPIVLTEVRLKDKDGKSAGNIDILLVKLDANGQVLDFGALEVQAVYISGNVRDVFRKYMEDPAANARLEWPARNYPKPDYLSSSRKRLAPQLIFKGGILHAWNKRIAVAVHRAFYDTLPPLPTVTPEEAEIAWFIYDLNYRTDLGRYELERADVRYTRFQEALTTIATPQPGDLNEFVKSVETRIRKGQLTGTPPPAQVAPSVEPLPNLFENDSQGDTT